MSSSVHNPFADEAQPGLPQTAGLQPEPLDEVALSRLRELDPTGQHGVVLRVMQAFDASLSRTLEQLADPQVAGDPRAVKIIAHTFKSSSASVGALALTRVCSDVERLLREGQVSDLGAQVERLLQQGNAALMSVRAMLRK